MCNCQNNLSSGISMVYITIFKFFKSFIDSGIFSISLLCKSNTLSDLSILISVGIQYIEQLDNLSSSRYLNDYRILNY